MIVPIRMIYKNGMDTVYGADVHFTQIGWLSTLCPRDQTTTSYVG